MMYKHRRPSTTSLSDNDDDDHLPKDAFQDSSAIAVTPAQFTTSKPRDQPHDSQPPAQSPISRLPPEILIQVFRHIHSPRDLYSSLRVSRTWCQCSVELLWHRPTFTKAETLIRVTNLLSKTDQTFTYANFIRRLNFLALAKDMNDDILSVLSQCDRLERLTLVNCDNLTGLCLSNALPHFPNIVAIDLSGVSNTNDAAIVGLGSAARRLQGINLAGCKAVTDVGMSALATNCPLLRRVKLSGLSLLTDVAVSAIAKSCPLLLEVDLNYCELITDSSIRDIWTYSTQMREMRLSHCPELTDLAFPAPVRKDNAHPADVLNPFPSNTPPIYDELPPLVLKRPFEHLRMLDLTACSQVTDDSVEGIISHAPRIRNLVLSKCSLLTDRSVENICRLGRNLHYLHLGHAAQITDRSVRTLARSCTRLRYVDFANCVLLTDMSVFELSALPKLRRIGLVRVSNLTDEAIFALAERHATLERIHLSYCDQISVMAIHFLVQKLHKLTHLSLTGVPSFRQPELQQFCREPPQDFNTTQQLAFCVYSGKGVSQLRAFLTELFDHITEMNPTDDTEYEDDDSFQEDDNTPEPERELEDDDEFPTAQRRFIDVPNLSQTLAARANRHHLLPETIRPNNSGTQTNVSANLQGAANRLNAQIMAAHNAGPSRRLRAPPMTSGPSLPSPPILVHRSVTEILPIVESQSPPPSDVGSNRSAGTNRSNGATFFRNYPEGPTSPPANGTQTPDLHYAELGHGRGTHPMRRGQEQHSSRRISAEEVPTRSATTVGPSSSRTPIAVRTEATTQAPVTWPYEEPASPSEGGPSTAGPSNSTTPDARGRSVKRSLRNTFSAAEHYASTLLFGRDRQGRSPARQDENANSNQESGSRH